MKRYIALFAFLCSFLVSFAQATVKVWKNGQVFYTAEADSITYDLNLATTYMVGDVEFNMIKVYAGSFNMGLQKSDVSDADPKEGPVHKVNLTQDYYMGETVVTQALWIAVMGDNTNAMKSLKAFPQRIGDDYPIAFATDAEMNTFMTKINSLLADKIPEGYEFGFPTLAQWQYAACAREEVIEHLYSGTNYTTEEDFLKYVDYNKNRDKDTPYPVKQLLPNALGLYGMSGGVYEFTSDYSTSQSTANLPNYEVTDPSMPKDATHVHRIACGGTYNLPTSRRRECRVTWYDCQYYNDRTNRGFRLALIKKP